MKPDGYAMNALRLWGMKMTGQARGALAIRRAPVRAVVAGALALLLAGCESSSRLGSLLPDTGYRGPSSARAATPPPLTPAPAGDVESSALPPPPGGGTSGALPPPGPGLSGGVATAPGVAVAPPQNPVVSPAIPPAPPLIADAAPANAGPPSRTALIGNWSVSEANGVRCKITLSSAPKLDLYGAVTTGCQNKELQRINAWELAGSEVILYEPGGGVIARLRGAGGQNYAGATAKSGAPINMTK
jgi:Protease inhibitor Inh